MSERRDVQESVMAVDSERSGRSDHILTASLTGRQALRKWVARLLYYQYRKSAQISASCGWGI